MNLLIAGFAVFIMLAGAGVVGFTYYSTNVVMPEELPLPLSTTVYAKDGKTTLAKLGSENRTFVTINQIPEYVQHAVAAAEDRNFYRHSGVDYKGIVRAAWNNVSNGDKQGASTITQQYARNAFENLKDDTYGRKVKEAILASKLNDAYSKPEIMQHYLNVIYFGRGAYGIEAAAQTYFGKPAIKLTPAEGAVTAALIKQPVASDTHQGYDPAVNPTDAKTRWDYVIGGMKKEGWLDSPTTHRRPPSTPRCCRRRRTATASASTALGATSSTTSVRRWTRWASAPTPARRARRAVSTPCATAATGSPPPSTRSSRRPPRTRRCSRRRAPSSTTSPRT